MEKISRREVEEFRNRKKRFMGNWTFEKLTYKADIYQQIMKVWTTFQWICSEFILKSRFPHFHLTVILIIPLLEIFFRKGVLGNLEKTLWSMKWIKKVQWNIFAWIFFYFRCNCKPNNIFAFVFYFAQMSLRRFSCSNSLKLKCSSPSI